jgi:hypothetical protein
LLLPWKRDEIDTSNLSIDLKLRVWIMNLVSRLIGAVVRSGVIIVGLGAIALSVIGAIVVIGAFLALPIIAIYLLISAFI